MQVNSLQSLQRGQCPFCRRPMPPEPITDLLIMEAGPPPLPTITEEDFKLIRLDGAPRMVVRVGTGHPARGLASTYGYLFVHHGGFRVKFFDPRAPDVEVLASKPDAGIPMVKALVWFHGYRVMSRAGRLAFALDALEKREDLRFLGARRRQ